MDFRYVVIGGSEILQKKLQRLVALGWIRCDGKVGEDQLDEAKRKGGV